MSEEMTILPTRAKWFSVEEMLDTSSKMLYSNLHEQRTTQHPIDCRGITSAKATGCEIRVEPDGLHRKLNPRDSQKGKDQVIPNRHPVQAPLTQGRD